MDTPRRPVPCARRPRARRDAVAGLGGDVAGGEQLTAVLGMQGEVLVGDAEHHAVDREGAADVGLADLQAALHRYQQLVDGDAVEAFTGVRLGGVAHGQGEQDPLAAHLRRRAVEGEGEAHAEDAVHPELQQRGHRLPLERELQHDRVVVPDELPLALRVDAEIGVGRGRLRGPGP